MENLVRSTDYPIFHSTAERVGDAVPECLALQPCPSASRPLITVVITCYNHGRFLKAAITSAAGQTYRPIEIIVVDDGSTDETPNVLASYPKIIAIQQENQGLSTARNVGLHAAHGEFITFLDADDLLLAGALEYGFAHFSKYPECAFVAGGYQLIDQNGRSLSPPIVDDVRHDHYLKMLHNNYIGMHATVLYRRDDLLAIGGFDTSLRAAEDYDVFLKIARSRPIAHYNRVIALYRRHQANMSLQYDLMLRSVLAVLNAQIAHCLSEPQRLAALRQGTDWWHHYYGSLLFRRFVMHLLTPRTWAEGGRDMKTLYHYAGIKIPFIIGRLGIRAGLKVTLARLPAGLRDRLRARWRAWSLRPPLGQVDFGSLHRTRPISDDFGFDRGHPVDRYYIEAFLEQHAHDIGGRVLEIGDNAYTVRFSGNRLVHSDVLNVQPGDPRTTIVADLSNADHIPSDSFDCIVITQTLHLIYDMRAAVRTLHRILKPGGVVLATAPGISQIDHGEWSNSWYWSLTGQSAMRMFGEAFLSDNITVTTFGNVLAATSFLYGLASAEMERSELDVHDPSYPVIVAIRAVKSPISK